MSSDLPHSEASAFAAGDCAVLEAAHDSSAAPSVRPARNRPTTRRDSGARAGLAAAALSFWPALLLLDAAWAAARGWRSESKVDTLALLGSGLFVAVVLMASCVPRLRARLARLWAPCVLVAASIGLAWGVAEVGLRLFAAHRLEPPFHCRWPNVEIDFRPDPSVMPGISGVGRYRTNSHGLRGPELPADRGVYRILCLGGSTTECGYLDDTETWPHLLSEQLNSDGRLGSVWVNDAGISGYSSRHHARFATDSDLMNEIDCLAVLVGINDFCHYLETEQLSRDVADEERRLEERRPFWCRSAVRELARAIANTHFGELTHQAEDLQGHNYELRRAERQAAPVEDALPPLDAALADYQHHLATIIEAARAQGVRVVFLTQPVLWSADLDAEAQKLLWLGWTKNGHYLTPARLREGIDEFNRAMMETCREYDVELIDLALLHGERAIFYDDCHYTELGAARVAEMVAAGLLAAEAQRAATAESTER